MHRLSIILLTLFLSSAPHAQLTFPITKGYDSAAWESFEQQVPQNVVMQFINQHLSYFKPYGSEDEFAPTIANLIKCLHFIDLNNDGLIDVIFEGRSSGEGSRIAIFMNDGRQYKNVFEGRQGVRKIDWDNKKIKRVYIDDWGCCADFVEFKKIYEVTYSGNPPSFKIIYQAASMFNGQQPDSAFDAPIHFRVLNDNCNFRAAPSIDDTSFEPWQEDDTAKNITGKGNTIGKLPAGATGTAIARYTDSSGRVWWYVEIDESYPLKQSAFYENDDVKFATKKIGWLSRQFIRRL